MADRRCRKPHNEWRLSATKIYCETNQSLAFRNPGLAIGEARDRRRHAHVRLRSRSLGCDCIDTSPSEQDAIFARHGGLEKFGIGVRVSRVSWGDTRATRLGYPLELNLTPFARSVRIRRVPGGALLAWIYFIDAMCATN
jgi:hypothetical protein